MHESHISTQEKVGGTWIFHRIRAKNFFSISENWTFLVDLSFWSIAWGMFFWLVMIRNWIVVLEHHVLDMSDVSYSLRKSLKIENVHFINFAKYAIEFSRDLFFFFSIAGTLTKIEKNHIPKYYCLEKRI